MTLPLEDSYADIVAKAARGQGVSLGPLPSDEEGIRNLALRLGLCPQALWESALGAWQPAEPEGVEGLKIFTTDFGGMLVNSYVIFDPVSQEAAAFDTGADCTEMLRLGLPIRQIFLTHLHGDHIFDVDRLREKTGAVVRSSAREPLPGSVPFRDGEHFKIGALEVEARRTSGHAVGGTTFVVRGLACPLAIVGDALFAGSMGGAPNAYSEALETARTAIFSLGDDTILCPGHGPLTTVGQEKRHNPFFAPLGN